MKIKTLYVILVTTLLIILTFSMFFRPLETVCAQTLVAPSGAFASKSLIDLGQSSVFSVTTNASNGITPYSYQWLGEPPGANTFSAISGATTLPYNWSSTGATLGNWSFELQVTDSASNVVTSNVFNVTINTDPTVTLTPTAVTVDVGQAALFRSNPTGGSGIYMFYQYYLNGTLQSGQSSSGYSFVPTSTGTELITATVTDSLEYTSVKSASPSITVNPALNTSPITISLNTVIQGQTSILNATVTNGTPPYAYQWFSEAPGTSSYSSISGANVTSYNFVTSTSTTTGSWNFMLQVTDSAGNVVNSMAASVAVETALVAPNTTAYSGIQFYTVNQGQELIVTTSVVTTGTAPYSYQWFEATPDVPTFSSIIGATAPDYYFSTSTNTATGSWSFMVQITDATDQTVNSTVAQVTVNLISSTPTPTPSPSPAVTPSPTASPTSSPSPSPSPTPTIAEFPSVLVVAIILLVAAAVPLFRTKTKRINNQK